MVKSKKSPKTNLDLRSFELMPNVLVKNIVEIYSEKRAIEEISSSHGTLNFTELEMKNKYENILIEKDKKI